MLICVGSQSAIDRNDQNITIKVKSNSMPDEEPEGSCTVRDYWDGQLQQKFYPFTEKQRLFNCKYFGPITPLPTGGEVPSAVVSQGNIVGTIGGHPFEASLACASLTNWYQDSCADPADPNMCSFQLAQLFLKQGLPYPRVEVREYGRCLGYKTDCQIDGDRISKGIPKIIRNPAGSDNVNATRYGFTKSLGVTIGKL